jgi:hypothetical protein
LFGPDAVLTKLTIQEADTLHKKYVEICLLLAQIRNSEGIDQSVSSNDVWGFFQYSYYIF